MADIQRHGQAKPRTWDDGKTVSNASAIGDGTIAEAMAALGYGWNATSSAWVKLQVDNASGGLTVDTELPAAAALIDGASNPTTPTVGAAMLGKAVDGLWYRLTALQPNADAQAVTPVVPGNLAFSHVYNGASWDRARGDVANGLDVDVTRLPVGHNIIDAGSAVVPVNDNAGSLTVDAPVGTPVFSRLSDGAAALIGQKAMASSLPVAISSDQSAVGVTPPTLTKGTQGATGFSVQDLKDSGRVNIAWTAEFAFAQVAETLLTITESRDGAATSTFTTKIVTSGKRLRITSVQMEVESLGTGTTPQRAYLRMRFNTAGAATTGSPLQGVWGLGVTTAIVKASEKEAWSFPDGIEFLGDGTKQIGFSLETPDWVVTTATGRAKITITAFEY